MNKEIVFIIVTYQPEKNMLGDLRAVLSGWEVIVVDNTKNNRGYGGGANVGMKQAMRQGAQWFVIMNQDVKMTKESVRAFTDILRKSQPAIVGPFAGQLDPKRWTTIVPAAKMDYISGSVFAIHRDVIDKIGYFFQPYFMYYEEVDYCIRARRGGFPLRWLPISGITHEESVGLGKGSFLHEYYLARNHLLFVERSAPRSVKLREFLRLPKTLIERLSNLGALIGLFHYFIRRFGKL